MGLPCSYLLTPLAISSTSNQSAIQYLNSVHTHVSCRGHNGRELHPSLGRPIMALKQPHHTVVISSNSSSSNSKSSNNNVRQPNQHCVEQNGPDQNGLGSACGSNAATTSLATGTGLPPHSPSTRAFSWTVLRWLAGGAVIAVPHSIRV